MVRVAFLAVALALVPMLVQSNHLLGLFITVLFSTYLAQSWYLLGGLCGQFSFGHAAFFGVGLYASFILQVDFACPPVLAMIGAAFAGGFVALFIGAVSFRYGLRGSYFALVTLAFAEILRMVAGVLELTGGGQGKYLPTRLGAEYLQFSKSGYFYFILVMFVLVHVLFLSIQRSRLGARFAAIREDEEAAAALGVDVLRHKLIAIVLSGVIAGLGGAFYGQYYFYVDPQIAFGATVSIEMLLAPIIGGAGTLFGPLVGAVLLRTAAEAGQSVTGGMPGFNMILYGVVVILIVRFMPDGVVGGAKRAWELLGVRSARARE